MTKEEQYLISHAHDKYNECINKNMITATGFLDMHEQTVLANERFSGRFMFFGGYEDAERKILCFLPDYLEEPEGLSVLKAVYRGHKKLTHRDFLGSLMSLGIKRENIGDIIVSDNGAQIIIKDEIGEFLLTNLASAGRATLALELLPVSELVLSKAEVKEVLKTVASLRLDSVVAAIFNISRTQSCGFIAAGKVFLNSQEVLKPDKPICEGDKLTLRSKGKAVITSASGTSKKGRVILKANLYI